MAADLSRPPFGGNAPRAQRRPSIEFYQVQAQRLLALASTSPSREARAELLFLAQAYEALAEHATLDAGRGPRAAAARR